MKQLIFYFCVIGMIIWSLFCGGMTIFSLASASHAVSSASSSAAQAGASIGIMIVLGFWALFGFSLLLALGLWPLSVSQTLLANYN